MNNILTLLQQRYTTKLWQDKPVTDTQLDYVLQCAYLAPSKMAHHSHKIVALTDSVEGKAIKDWLFYEHTWSWDGYPAYKVPKDHVSAEQRDYNGQYRAPVLLIWLSELKDGGRVQVHTQIKDQKIQYHVTVPDADQQRSDIYISATAAMLAAEELGLNTGYGVCHDSRTVAERVNMSGYHAVVVLGMGYPQPVSDNLDQPVLNVDGHTVGVSVPNTPPGAPHWNRDARPNLHHMVTVI